MRKFIKSNKWLLYFSSALLDMYYTIASYLNKKYGKHNEYTRSLRANGFVILKEAVDVGLCQEIKKEIDLKVEEYGASYSTDRRLWGFDKIAPSSEIFFKLIENIQGSIGERYLGSELFLQTIMAGKIQFEGGNLGSGMGWHRDSFSRQFKVIIYLSDVCEKNGPFQFLAGSHKLSSISKTFKNNSISNGTSTRYSDSDISEIIKNEKLEITTVCGKAGAIVLADTRGIHRGMPLMEGTRYAITKYYVGNKFRKKNTEIELLSKENEKKFLSREEII
ncbi:MAG: phytanoyl-CoA dioxygenase family protein [Coxiellaceae bacterium]|nr:phytanoyl-CoA dioxygenase family protein [Coxiellaceae bacterium]